MKATTESETGGARIMGKKELCAALNWTRPRLDRRLDSDAEFPIVRRGDRTGGWEFDLDVVLAHLGTPKPASRAAAPRAAAAPARQAAPASEDPPRAAEHGGEMTQRQRRDAAQSGLLEDKLRMQRGELVRAEEVRMVVTTMLARFAKGLDNMPDTIVSRLGLPEESTAPLQSLFDDLRQNMVLDVRKLLSPPRDV